MRIISQQKQISSEHLFRESEAENVDNVGNVDIKKFRTNHDVECGKNARNSKIMLTENKQTTPYV